MTQLSTGGHHLASERERIYKLLTTALILGSKFLDDNTFINRSWSEVSGIDVHVLNRLETEWLVAIEFTLHRDLDGSQGFNAWLKHWKDFETQALTRPAKSLKLSPLDTNVQRQRSVHKSYTSAAAQQTYGKLPMHDYSASALPTPYTSVAAYAHYDPWMASRAPTETSPPSAPHTGPTTPEYYGGSATWAPPEGYPRRSMFNFPQLNSNAQMPQAQPQSAAFTPYTPQYAYNPWSSHGHGMGCSCMYCASRQQPPYYMVPGYGPLPVAG
ncbi:hypothetical protein LTS18_014098 [Coniosporium uncinatum]|uniref:Uncharacterized protein n=1 Tax=Coniosporium uncinatum TaxID=93489 RepID=A0ACC3CW18_9PEZI|nr:hypothetical protein LTS18_014098 [Coniosporium uncinatum]